MGPPPRSRRPLPGQTASLPDASSSPKGMVASELPVAPAATSSRGSPSVQRVPEKRSRRILVSSHQLTAPAASRMPQRALNEADSVAAVSRLDLAWGSTSERRFGGPLADAPKRWSLQTKFGFIHFFDEALQSASLGRSSSCPSSFAPGSEETPRSAEEPELPVARHPSEPFPTSAKPEAVAEKGAWVQLALRGVQNRGLPSAVAPRPGAPTPAAASPLAQPPVASSSSTLRLRPSAGVGNVAPEASRSPATPSVSTPCSRQTAQSSSALPQKVADEEAQDMCSTSTATSAVHPREADDLSGDAKEEEWTQVPKRKKDRGRDPVKEEELTGGASADPTGSGSDDVDGASTHVLGAPDEEPAATDEWTAVPTKQRGAKKADSSNNLATALSSADAIKATSAPETPKERQRTESCRSSTGSSEAWAKTAPTKFEVGVPQEDGFNVMRRLLVPLGGQIREISEKTGARLCVRGHGSGHLEGPDRQEAKEPLMVCVCGNPSPAGLAQATVLVEQMIVDIRAEYAAQKSRKGDSRRQVDN